MKFRVGDTVLVTGGKDKGKQGKIIGVMNERDAVVVDGVNLYVKHIKPQGETAGQKVQRPRALPTAKVAIINGEGKADRIGFKVNKDGSKVRIFKKTGKEVPTPEKKK
jgi:large subunit ribosomal protein L24